MSRSCITPPDTSMRSPGPFANVYVALSTWNGSPSTSTLCGTVEFVGCVMALLPVLDGVVEGTARAETVEVDGSGAEVLKAVLLRDFLGSDGFDGSGAFLQSFFLGSHAEEELDELEAGGGDTMPTTGSVGLTAGATTAGTNGTVAGGTTTVAGAATDGATVTRGAAVVAGAATVGVNEAAAGGAAAVDVVGVAADTPPFTVAPVVLVVPVVGETSEVCPTAETLVDVCTTEDA
jgi:hypothetical protein